MTDEAKLYPVDLAQVRQKLESAQIIVDECNLPLQSPQLDTASSLIESVRRELPAAGHVQENALKRIADILWPDGDPDAEWNGGDVCQEVAAVLHETGFAP